MSLIQQAISFENQPGQTQNVAKCSDVIIEVMTTQITWLSRLMIDFRYLWRKAFPRLEKRKYILYLSKRAF